MLFTNGVTDTKQALAYQLMDEGKYRKAREIFDFEDEKRGITDLYNLKIKNAEIKSSTAENAIFIKNEAQRRLDNIEVMIKLDSALAKNTNDWDRINTYYKEAVKLVDNFQCHKLILYRYSKFGTA